MNKTTNHKTYDLAERTFNFSKRVRVFIKNIPKTIMGIEDTKQLVRSSGSVGANYIEAEECLSKKDFVMRIKISRKEAKESVYWLKLLEPKEVFIAEQKALIQEATELTKIFGSIVEKCK
ncbi:four helix bundle protein [Candidatus Omnitrophota bacterium]